MGSVRNRCCNILSVLVEMQSAVTTFRVATLSTTMGWRSLADWLVVIIETICPASLQSVFTGEAADDHAGALSFETCLSVHFLLCCGDAHLAA